MALVFTAVLMANTRTPIPHASGAESRSGDPQEAARLSQLLRVREDDAAVLTRGLHAVHPFPGRLHPVWVRRLLASLPPDSRILDPFCGGGTVLVEARRAGLVCGGSDVHPVAARLAELKGRGRAPREAVQAEAERCADGSRKRRETPFSRLAQGEKSYLPHVLATLIALRDEIEATEDFAVREVLLFSLTPLLDKLSARSDRGPVAMSAHAVRDHFLERAERWCGFFEELGQAPPADVECADARDLPFADGVATVIVTSPPYPGVYDYAAGQERWGRWLGIGARKQRDAEERELGRSEDVHEWSSMMESALAEMIRVTHGESPIFLFIADGVLRGRPVRVDRELARICRGLPMRLIAVASQDRPHLHLGTAGAFDGGPRREHLIELRTA